MSGSFETPSTHSVPDGLETNVDDPDQTRKLSLSRNQAVPHQPIDAEISDKSRFAVPAWHLTTPQVYRDPLERSAAEGHATGARLFHPCIRTPDELERELNGKRYLQRRGQSSSTSSIASEELSR